MVYRLLGLYGGTIHVASAGAKQEPTPNDWSTVERNHPVMEQNPTQARQPVDLNGIRVLAVDDDIDNLELIMFVLEEAGATVTAVSSANEALSVLPQLQPDILLSDIGMPRVDGYTLIRQVRMLPPEQGGEIPAIALTAYAAERDQQQALAAGFQQHISKPVSSGELIIAIVNLITPRNLA